jgi:DNA replication ATP-dependent helicase Dna2
MSFALTQKSYKAALKYHLHHFRVEVESQEFDSDKWSMEALEALFYEGKWAIWKFLEMWYGASLPVVADFSFTPKSYHKKPSDKKEKFIRQAKMLVIGEGALSNTLRVVDSMHPDEEIVLSYADVGRNDIFTQDIKSALSCPSPPFMISLVDIEVQIDGTYIPRYLVVEPDFLIDVSTIAECARDFKSPSYLNLIRKFLPVESNPAILMGHISNSFLDTLIHQPDVRFEDIFHHVFRLNPLAFTCLPDAEIISLMRKAKGHFENLKAVVMADFGRQGLERTDCVIEPAFYAPTFGIQGRLDVFHQANKQTQGADIIELKSGKPFRPNLHGLNANHYSQTLLYDLLIRAVLQFKQKNKCYILYSSQEVNSLRFAPSVDSLQKEAIHIRNQLALLEAQMRNASQDEMGKLLSKISMDVFPDAKGFLKRDIEDFEGKYQSLAPSEKIYFNLYSGFASREFGLSKIGEQGVENVNGLASLWLDTITEKIHKFSIFKSLQLRKLEEEHESTFVYFDFSLEGELLSNFRIGDIAVLYPDDGDRESVLHHQIYKCTLVDIQESGIVVKLRNHQINRQTFQQYHLWNVEHDTLDSSFITLFRSLYAFASYTPLQRSVFLGSVHPHQPEKVREIPKYPAMLPEQYRVLRKMIEAKDYFLLWGPPGTGKTSIMIKYTVDYYLQHSNKNLLLLAYTNRAVDEMCASIETLGSDIRTVYTRIGSRVGTHPLYRDQLFDTKTKDFTRRKEVISFLKSQRIIVATISSIVNKSDLFKLKTFHIAIIDEASQILEPMLAGLLPRFEKKILIGDHKQLPAVVMQRPSHTIVEDDRMARIHLRDLRNSYFERMFLHCQEKKWDWAFDRLSIQGRMHMEIMDFVNQQFYENGLFTMQQLEGKASMQEGKIAYDHVPENVRPFDKVIFQRMSFLKATVSKQDRIIKANEDEARICAHLIKVYQSLYRANQIKWNANTLGIITPFRAQIALIRKTCLEEGVDLKEITIDTVERYQGSAREIIILSTAVSSPSQLSMIISENHEGIDRKLNVSITRAKKQFIMVGDPETLNRNSTYNHFINRYALDLEAMPDQ